MDEKQLKKEITTVSGFDIVVNNQENYKAAGEMILNIDSVIKRIKEYWEPEKKKASDLHKSIVAKEKEMLAGPLSKREIIKKVMIAFSMEEERRTRERQAQINREREKAERKERERLERNAKAAERRGNEELAQDLREQKENVFIPQEIAVPEVAKTESTDAGNITQKKDIRVTVTDTRKVIEAVLSGRIPDIVIDINITRLKQAIKVNGINHIDGVIIEQVIVPVFTKTRGN